MPSKRAALLLDRIMVALQKAVDDGKDSKLRGYYPESGVSCLYSLLNLNKQKANVKSEGILFVVFVTDNRKNTPDHGRRLSIFQSVTH